MTTICSHLGFESDLSTRPEVVAALRVEAEKVLGEEGWSKAAMQKLIKLDSFLRESQRLNGIGASIYSSYALAYANDILAGSRRIAMKDFTFSDGTPVPAGQAVSTPVFDIHLNPVRLSAALCCPSDL